MSNTLRIREAPTEYRAPLLDSATHARLYYTGETKHGSKHQNIVYGLNDKEGFDDEDP